MIIDHTGEMIICSSCELIICSYDHILYQVASRRRRGRPPLLLKHRAGYVTTQCLGGRVGLLSRIDGELWGAKVRARKQHNSRAIGHWAGRVGTWARHARARPGVAGWSSCVVPTQPWLGGDLPFDYLNVPSPVPLARRLD